MTACSGGGGGQLPPSGSGSGGQTATVHFHIAVADQTSSSVAAARKKPLYVSTATKSAAIAVRQSGAQTVTEAVLECTSTCDGDVQAPVGTDAFTITLFDQSNGAGNALSTGSTTATVAANQTNTVSVTFNGIVYSVALSADPLAAGTAASEPLTVLVKDRDGKAIVGAGTYVDAGGNPLTLRLSSTDTTSGGSGAITLSTATLHSPADIVTLHYNGGSMYSSSISVTATGAVAGGLQGTTLPVNPAVVQTTPVGAIATKLTVARDGSIWYAEHYGDQIGHVTLGGSFSEYVLPLFPDMTAGSTLDPGEIVTGSDGNVWFNFEAYSIGTPNDSGIGKITSDGTLTLYRDPNAGMVFPIGLTLGSDGNVWFSEANRNAVGSMTTSGVTTDYPLPSCNGYGSPTQLTTGPDGNVWISDNRCIVKVTPSGVATAYSIPSASSGYYADAITTGPDGNIWFTETTQNGGPPSSKIAEITPSGTITEYPVPANHWAVGLYRGGDGNLWFIDGYSASRLGTMSKNGTVTFYVIASAPNGINAMLPTAGGDFYVTMPGSPASVGRLVY